MRKKGKKKVSFRYPLKNDTFPQESKKSKVNWEIIQDSMNVKRIRILSPVDLGLRRGGKGKGPRGHLILNIGKEEDSPKQELNTNSSKLLPVLKRELIILHDEWSRTDANEDVYTIINDSGHPVEQVRIRTELFRDELEIFDVKGRKLYFESCKEKADELETSNPWYSPYSFLVSLHSPLQVDEKTTLKLRYIVISDYSSELRQIVNGIRDAIPFVINESYFYRFFEIDRIFVKDRKELTFTMKREFSFTMKLREGTTATSYVILGIDGKDLSIKVFDTQKDGTDESNYYAEGNEVFFAFSEERLKTLKYLIVFLRISPERRGFLAISSIQFLTVSVLVSLALVIHSQPFRDSFSLITGLFLASLTLLLYPERSRLMDPRTSVSIYSVILSIVVILHVTSQYGNFEIVSDILNEFPTLRLSLLPAALISLVMYIIYVLYDWTRRRDFFHRLLRWRQKANNYRIDKDKV